MNLEETRINERVRISQPIILPLPEATSGRLLR